MENNMYDSNKTKSNKGVMIGLVLAIVVLAGACVYFYLDKNNDVKDNNDIVNENVDKTDDNEECEECKVCEVCEVSNKNEVLFDKNKTEIQELKSIENDHLVIKTNIYDVNGLGEGITVSLDMYANVNFFFPSANVTEFKAIGYTLKITADKEYKILNVKPVVQIEWYAHPDYGTVVLFLLSDGRVEEISLENMLENKFTPSIINGLSNVNNIKTLSVSSGSSYVVAILNDGTSKLIKTL